MSVVVRRTPTPLRLAAAAAVLAVLTSGCGGMVTIRATGTVDLAPVAQTSRIVAADGTILAQLHGEQDRDPVALRDIAAVMRDAIVAVEDARFYRHAGVDARGIIRALVRNVQEGRVTEGGSTITQQLAKTRVTGDERSLKRKLQEASVALQLEQQYSKDEILERYLNTVYFGNGTYGVQAAAQRYFGVDAGALTLPQAALLAAIVKSPNTYDPYRAPEAALARRNLVIELLREQGRINDAVAQAARSTPLDVAPPQPRDWRAPWFVDHVLHSLQHDPEFAVLGDDAIARADRLFHGGLRIETTVDLYWQDAAERAVAETLTDPADPRAALVAIDPQSGEVRALVGGRVHQDAADPYSHFNLATDGRRQPGSAFKPLVLAAALARGRTLDERFPGGASVTIPDADGGEAWTVSNYDGTEFGSLTLREATAKSVNTVYARLVADIGADAVAALAQAAGVRAPLAPLPSIALGAQEVSPLDLATVQATLASGGVARTPAVVRRIVGPDDTVLYERGREAGDRVMDASVAAAVTVALQDVVREGTGTRADLRRPVAGKTGTSQDGADAWFAGYTPDLAAAVWVGFPDARRSMEPPTTRIRVEGGTWPAEIFARFGLRALQDIPAHDFPAPPGRSCAPGTCAQAPVPVDVPRVVGLPAERAEALLSAAGFRVERMQEPSVSLPPGYVLRQTPEPGPDQPVRGSLVARIVVSTAGGAPPASPPEEPSARIPVPDVLGRPSEEAAAALRAAGFTVSVVVGCPGGAETCGGALLRPGQVWEQRPEAGEPLAPGTSVQLSTYPS